MRNPADQPTGRVASAINLRALITHLQIMGAIITEALAEGQTAIDQLGAMDGNAIKLEQLRTALLHATNLLANAQIALPNIADLQRQIAAFMTYPAERITNDFGDQVRTHDHGQNQKVVVHAPRDAAAHSAFTLQPSQARGAA